MVEVKEPSLAKATATMAITTAVSRLTGFLKWLTIAYALGRTALSDSYNLANNLPNMIFELVVGGVLTAAFIPVVMDYLSQGDEEESWRVASLILNFVLVCLLFIVALGVLFPYPFVRLQTLLVSPEKIRVVMFFFRIFIIQIVFYGCCAVFTGILNARRHFFLPMAAPILNNLVVIATLLAFVRLSERSLTLALWVLALGTTFGVVAMALVQLPMVLKVGFRYKPVFAFADPNLKRFLLLGVPTLVFVFFNQLGNTVINNLAFQFKGGVSAYIYSWAFFQLPHGILSVSIIVALFPSLCEAFSLKDMEKFKTHLSLGLRTITFVVAPASAFLVALSPQILELALERGKFTHADTLFTASVLSYFALGILSFGITTFLARSFYALKDAKTPTAVISTGIVLMSLLNIFLVAQMGVKGIGLANTIAYTLTFVALIYLMRQRIGALNGRAIARSMAKCVLAAVAMGFVMYFFARLWGQYVSLGGLKGSLLELLLAGLLGLLVYSFLSYLFKLEEIDVLKRLFKKGLARLGLESKAW
jgi:putative peptidoglycan lipid II flippase